MKNKIIAGVVFSVLSSTAQAAYLDLRHEYRDPSDRHRTRLILGNHFDNGYGIEMLTNVFHGSYGDSFGENLRISNTEITNYYTYAVNKNFTLNPGLTMNFLSSNTFMMPYLKLNYNFDNGLFVHGRYRYDFSNAPMQNDFGEDETVRRNRYDVWTGYNTDDYQVSYAYTYFDQITAHSGELANGELTGREHTFKLVYKWKPDVRPYLQLVDADKNIYIPGDNAGETEWRYQIGLNLAF
ncbi:oligogalacturonate-specific porin KdgM family protein [Psychromonas aquimarina]|uniref:oligogalacturonate-specific porin KdgM family protein n=1 Tax=Psychromonas aquimarina TaxID=444919 RepID=UPI000410EBA5|nr:oligogalacturonate-specific porin KdgM family protein [Psychromonas aquimarina]